MKSGLKRVALAVTAVVIGSALGLAIAEGIARAMEPRKLDPYKMHAQHPLLGWIPSSGRTTVVTDEYTATYDVNAMGMNDRPVEESLGRAKVRIVAVGDSNTFGQGVSQEEAWPNVLEKMLFGGNVDAGTVYNLGVIGYSLGQYLVRLREVQGILNPHIVVIGFAMHNDLYDVVPPGRAGFVYGGNLGRVYFDLDGQGELVEVWDLVGQKIRKGAAAVDGAASEGVRQFLGRHSALYRRYRRSDLAMWVAARVRVAGESLMPGMDTVLKRELTTEDEYRWRLAEKIIERMAREAQARGSKVLLVNIPYLPQAYDDLWAASFGTLPSRYDRWIGGERLARICERLGIQYVDTTRRFAEEARRRKKWLHFREDRHPTVDGHRVIAESVSVALKEGGLVD